MNSDLAFLSIIVPVLVCVVAVGALYFIIQNAIVAAMRRARREQFTEDYVPEKAKWLTEQQRAQLRLHADAAGRTTPVK